MPSYQPLARQYRPSRFAELVGQDAVATALANAIASGRILPNLIFTGVRGVGKTTVARLYAKALNCEARQPPAEPCNACASCLAIAQGHHEDVLEIDGASNTSVNDVRALQETIEYAPQRSQFKVYIIDEVHMLSTAAFNALLKTLEERRPHVIFVFATTELHRVPETILSRCPTFHLKKLAIPVVARRLAEILTAEGLPFEDKALSVIAREGHGSMRDALTLLDQAIALGDGRVTMAALGAIVSNLSSSPYLDLLGALVRREPAAALAAIEALDQGGADFAGVAEETARLARHGFVVRDLGADALDTALLGLDDAELARLGDLARAAGPFDLNRIFRTLLKCRQELDGSALDRFVVENYCFEWCLDPGLPDVEGLLGSVASAAPASPAAGNGAGGGAGTRAAPVPAVPQAASPAAGSGAGGGAGTRPGTARMRDVMSELKEQARGGGVPGKAQPPAAQAQPAGAEPPPPPAQPVAPAARAVQAPQAPAATAAPQPPSATPPPPAPAPAPEPPSSSSLPPTWRALVDAWRKQKPLQARKLEEVHPVEYTPDRIVLAVGEDSYVSKSLLSKDEQVRIREQFRELFGFAGALLVLPKGDVVRDRSRAGASAAPAAGSDEPPPPDDSWAPVDADEPPHPFAPPPGPEPRPAPPARAAAEGAAKAGASATAATPEALPDTVLDERSREADARRQALLEAARSAPFTKEVLAVFGATIEDVRIISDS